jgi:hypothetical protein
MHIPRIGEWVFVNEYRASFRVANTYDVVVVFLSTDSRSQLPIRHSNPNESRRSGRHAS